MSPTKLMEALRARKQSLAEMMDEQRRRSLFGLALETSWKVYGIETAIAYLEKEYHK